MKRRLFSGLLALVLCLCVCGCAGTRPVQTAQVPADYASARVSYLGPEGTYTQEACGVFFGMQGEYVPYTTVGEAVEALSRGETDFAVIPQENTIGGAVTDYLDVLIAHPETSVVGEVELPISQNLLALPGTALEQIRTVYSHKQGIAQSREWVEANLPQAELVEVSSTAEGARMVSELADPSCAAVASAGCAEVYQLEILAAGIQNNDRNQTRFYVLSLDAPAKEPSDRLAFLASGSAEALPALMAQIRSRKIILIFIHDRPQKTLLGEYDYLIECAGCGDRDYEKLTADSGFSFRYLGSFPVR